MIRVEISAMKYGNTKLIIIFNEPKPIADSCRKMVKDMIISL